MTTDQMLELARLAPRIDTTNIKQVVLEKPLVYGFRREDGAAVQLPKWDLINPVIADLFAAPVLTAAATPEPTLPPAQPTPTPTSAPISVEELQARAEEQVAAQGLIADAARIAIQNGTTDPDLASRVAASMREQGYQVVEVGDADLIYGNTVIVDYSGKEYTLERLVDMFRVTPENLRQSPNLRSPVDIRIFVGEDFLSSQS
jgi:hypothetical protein